VAIFGCISKIYNPSIGYFTGSIGVFFEFPQYHFHPSYPVPDILAGLEE
jgi:hypothetical protein